MDALTDQLLSASFLDWLAILTSLLYVWLAAKDNNWCWLFAAISTSVWAWQSFFEYQLVSDGLLQVFYFIMAGVGLWRWTRGQPNTPATSADTVPGTTSMPSTEDTSIQSMSFNEHLFVIGGGLLGGLALGFLFSNTLVAAATYPDAITTVFSIITTFLLISRRLENWLYWIVIDAVYVWIYGSTGAILFALMMLINIGMAVYGYLNWRKEQSKPNTSVTSGV
ncbi:nicotinamide riboside transporter PnuC [Neolewinella agarilytica]|uniref:Nicotinamide riboside transporter PnuC n=1 Tax=Neolewinella agarilytica TaxID=478744 RepID=A0A1H9BEF5_9BACT|nr:nicotinamide riboside transporter PnuC [Neolewinella agarilytica]SEP87334.1 nicotinamide mononucleotide transporter [Neolewinella agarilytica]